MTSLFNKLRSLLPEDSNAEALRKAVGVIQQLRKGNFKARAEVKVVNEAGKFLHMLNEMAEEVESIVERNQLLERSKTAWLQEMAHDLRTPLASMELAQTTLKESYDKLMTEQKKELIEDTLRETLHVKNLVEDLLFLSLLEDSQYFSTKEATPVVAFFNKTFEGYSERSLRHGKTFTFHNTLTTTAPDLNIKINHSLLSRLCRNCADNAMAYARSTVIVKLAHEADLKMIRLSFFSDSQQMSDQQLKDFGKKRQSRNSNKEGTMPPSLGLGSIIITRAATYLDAGLSLKNIVADSQREAGVLLEVSLKTL